MNTRQLWIQRITFAAETNVADTLLNSTKWKIINNSAAANE